MKKYFKFYFLVVAAVLIIIYIATTGIRCAHVGEFCGFGDVFFGIPFLFVVMAAIIFSRPKYDPANPTPTKYANYVIGTFFFAFGTLLLYAIVYRFLINNFAKY